MVRTFLGALLSTWFPLGKMSITEHAPCEYKNIS